MEERDPELFDMSRCRWRFSNELMLEDLRRFGKGRKRRGFNMKEFAAWRGRRCEAATIARRFHGWNHALRLAGFDVADTPEREREMLLEKLEGAWRKLGRRPGARSLLRLAGLSYKAYARVWGSLGRACERLCEYHRGELTREQLVAAAPARVGRARRVSPRMRFEVLSRDGYKCVLCGRGARDGVKLEVDHIVPVCQNGTDEMENLRTLCWECNRGKGGRHLALVQAR